MRFSQGFKLACALVMGISTNTAAALPIGFGINQGDLEYSELVSPHFIIYHDRRVPEEGLMTLNALEAVRPVMEQWFQKKRASNRPLPVIMSAVTDNASFANFITDAVELQTLGRGTRELAWHEYVHSTMYRTLDNFLGPAGNIIHLPWMPAWFLEGLAEALSVSVGSDVMAGMERYQALTGDWPSYDRLHSLYSKAGFAERGYATSGAMVTWLLRQGDANKLPVLLHDFYRYTMPWWWPWTMVPFNGFLPMDAAFENFAGRNGEQIYEEYKEKARDHWAAADMGKFLTGDEGPRADLAPLRGLKSDGKEIYKLSRDDHDDLYSAAVKFDKKSGFATGVRRIQPMIQDYESYARIARTGLIAGVKYETTPTGETSEIRIEQRPGTSSKKDKRKSQTKATVIARDATVLNLSETAGALTWIEYRQAESRFCMTEKSKKNAPVTCPLVVRMPRRLRYIGERPATDGKVAAEVWLAETEETLRGSRHRLHVFRGDKATVEPFGQPMAVQPLSVAFAGGDTWILAAERSARTLRRLQGDGACTAQVMVKDHVLDLLGLNDGSLVLGLYAGDREYLRRVKPADLGIIPCQEERPHASPLQNAMLSGGVPDLRQALEDADYRRWDKPTPEQATATTLASAKPLDQEKPAGRDPAAGPSKWRGRPVFAFPWIGADDAMGSQIGVVSVPLMDHMQNETVRATFLYGTESRFPYQELAMSSSRFTPTITLAAYRQQTYNGRFQRLATGEIVNAYMDEKGARLESDTDFKVIGGNASLGAGIKYAHLKPYIGPYTVRHGFLAEPAATFSLVHTFWEKLTWTNSISGRTAPEFMNEEFDYNQVGASTSLSLGLPFWGSRATAGLEGSRTRGKKMRELKEVYRPLKTYIPGSGGGYNQNSFPLAGEGTGLFSPAFGDTQGRAKATWTLPLIRELDKILWILYMERLDFTAFYNYGGAWTGDEPARGWDHLTRAHGYSVDLQLENKGVRFNLGVGAGQVIGKDVEVYLTTGFDALF